MKKNLLIICILASAILVAASFTSAIGVDVEKLNSKEENFGSPLYTIRQSSITKTPSKKINSNYLGKDRKSNIFFAKKATYSNAIDRTLKLIEKNPLILNLILEKLETDQIVIDKLNENDISMSEFKNYVRLIENNPSILTEEIKNIELNIPPGNTPLPAGLNDTNPLIIFILLITVVPIFIALAVVIATATIITCLNINSCFERLVEAFVGGFLQGLTPPDNFA